MKHYFRKIKIALALSFISIAFATVAQAQITVVSPSNSNTTLFTSSNVIQGINNAMIQNHASNYLFGSVYYDGTTNPSIYVNDPSISASTSISSTGNMASVPDVIIGNSTGSAFSICTTCNSSRDYILATAFVNNSGDAEIDFYKVHDQSGSFAITSLSGSHTFSGTNITTVHLDAIYSHGGIVNKYVVTWDDITGGGVDNIYAAYGDLNAGTISSATLMSGTNYGIKPDVAAIQYNGGSGPVVDVALITYIDAGNNALWYVYWDVTTTPTSPVQYDDGSSSAQIEMPRIDALDDYTINYTTSNENFNIVALIENSPSGKTDTRMYNNSTSFGPLVWQNVSQTVDIYGVGSYLTPVSDNFFHVPTVAVGYDGTRYDYSIQNYMHISSLSIDSDILFMEPMAYDGTPSYSIPLGYSVYWIDGNSSPLACIDGKDCKFANAVCSAPNGLSQPLVYEWGFYNGTNYEVDYKVTSAGTYGFRESYSNEVNNTGTENDWQAYPNPATNMITISKQGGISAVDNYSIIDVVGQVVGKGQFRDKSKLDISNLPSGTYLIKMYRGATDDGHFVFVKN